MFFLWISNDVAGCHNLPYDGSMGEKPKVRLPKGKKRGSDHQHLFEENIRKTKKRYANFEYKGSGDVYAWGRY